MDVLSRLPDDCTLEEIQYHLYVREKVDRGLREIDEGKVVTQEEVKRRLSKWTEL